MRVTTKKLNPRNPIPAHQPAAETAPAWTMQRPRVRSHDVSAVAATQSGNGSITALIAWVEHITGKKVPYQTAKQLEAYQRSLAGASLSRYDPDGWLKSLGVRLVSGCGRTLSNMMKAVRAVPDYVPDEGSTSKRLFALLKKSRRLFDAAIYLPSKVYELPSRLKASWRKPFVSRYSDRPDSDESPAKHYEDVHRRMADLGGRWATTPFHDDFHLGDNPGQPGQIYGTTAIARYLGFSAEQARRIGEADQGIDDNNTIYGKTDSYMQGAVDRHKNLNDLGAGEDTRLIWARRHLDAAIRLGRRRAFAAAEKELGHGLHSLQDLFAHGQLRGLQHAALGQFPDTVEYTPVAMAEATFATVAYLRAFARAVTAP